MEEAGEFQDWEMLQTLVENSRDFVEIDGDSEGVIRPNYFALDSENRYARTVAEGDVSEEGSVESDNPSWVDPCSESRYGDDARRELVLLQGITLGRKNSGEFWSDSSSDQSFSHNLYDFEANNYKVYAKNEVSLEGIGEIEANNSEFCPDSGGDRSVTGKEGESNSGGYDKTIDEPKLLAEPEEGEVLDGNMKSSSEGEKTTMVWWKLPLELFKFCVFRVSPVWSFSMAAALMGFVILGRRLYKMKRKSRTIPLKVTLEDKKVSQFMTRAARLNEAFSVVRRVPIIRPSLPAVGVTPWPVMSLR
ncbi:hypothetical protein HHK36_007724 [Tetracentron sinense]|uniref:DUF6821 domain-containing protein n=1 Tax=Tetracentron sinense TaxID=13715 RepID=A0A835DIN5_TETSI|nr:hypothetical protein HHK36_007724 [Tetracentron sinense]